MKFPPHLGGNSEGARTDLYRKSEAEGEADLRDLNMKLSSGLFTERYMKSSPPEEEEDLFMERDRNSGEPDGR